MAADELADQAFAVTATAYAGTPERWELAVHAGIAALFGFLAERPTRIAACIVEDWGSGPTGLAQRDRTIDRFTSLLQHGFETAPAPPPAVVAEAIGGGIYEIVRGHAREGRLAELPAAVPDATVVALAPFVGQAAANELARTTKVQSEG